MRINTFRAEWDCKTQSVKVFANVRETMKFMRTFMYLKSVEDPAYEKMLGKTEELDEIELPFAKLVFFGSTQGMECTADLCHVLNMLTDYYRKKGFSEKDLKFFEKLKEKQI